MSKKSIFPLLLAFMFAVSTPTGTYAEKESATGSSVSQASQTQSVKDDSKNKKDSTNTDNTSGGSSVAVPEENFPSLHTDYYLLADLDSGKILHSKNGSEKVFPASTTKILTAIIILERCNLTDTAVATEEAIAPITMKHSNMGIRVGEEFTVEQLLYGMLVASANDAANVLAVKTAGSLDEFAKLMNSKAHELGAENSNFVNPHGFHDDNHYTTVDDLAKITCYAMKNEKFAEIVSTAKYQIPPTDKYNETRYLSNTNMLISSNKGSMHLYKGAIGVKTGSTDEAGNCLVAAAESKGTRLLSIVMKCKNEGVGEHAYSFVDTRALFDYGFDNYEHKTIADTAEVIDSSKVREAKSGKRVSLSPSEEIRVLLPKDTDISTIKAEVQTDEHIKAPIKKGDILGTVTYTLNGETIGETKLVAGNDVERDLLLHIIFTIWNIISDPIVICAVIILAVLILYAKNVQKRKQRERRRRLRHLEEDDDD